MAVLVLDTATETLAGGVGTSEGLLGSTALRIPRGHSVLLQPVLADLMAHTGLAPSNVTKIGVGIGPGSYTGVRIGVSTAKAMAMALGIPLVTLSTLLALAESAVPGNPTGRVVVLPMLYARRQRAFGAYYEKVAGAWRVRRPPCVDTIEGWMDGLRDAGDGPAQDTRTCVVHDFQPKYGIDEDLIHTQSDQVLHLSEVSGQFAPALLQLVLGGYGSNWEGTEIHGVAPDYALPVEAEVKLAEGGEQSHGDC